MLESVKVRVNVALRYTGASISSVWRGTSTQEDQAVWIEWICEATEKFNAELFMQKNVRTNYNNSKGSVYNNTSYRAVLFIAFLRHVSVDFV